MQCCHMGYLREVNTLSKGSLLPTCRNRFTALPIDVGWVTTGWWNLVDACDQRKEGCVKKSFLTQRSSNVTGTFIIRLNIRVEFGTVEDSDDLSSAISGFQQKLAICGQTRYRIARTLGLFPRSYVLSSLLDVESAWSITKNCDYLEPVKWSPFVQLLSSCVRFSQNK